MDERGPAGGDRRRIDDYALIGDCESAALVHRDGTIAWLCWPRFDSEACFAALLGDESNGFWRIAAKDGKSRTERRYRPDTLILETRIETAGGAATLIDFMPIRGEASDVVRIVIGERGTVRLTSELLLRFDYGRLTPRWRQDGPRRRVAMVGPHAAALASDAAMTCGEDGRCHGEFTITAGERVSFVLTYFVAHEKTPDAVDPRIAFDETERFWTKWSGACTYQGPWRDAVVRSLIVMKALIYRPTGGIVAAPTSSLPERPGGTRNWDYRFCWLRDATFTLLALIHAGHDDEALAWRNWLLRAVGGDLSQLQPVYGLRGEARLPEWEAGWLAGFNGARPVRFGNAAYSQRQFDIYGEVIDALHQARRHGMEADPVGWRIQEQIVEHLARVWREPDQGIWETRSGARRFTHSQAMIWAAVDRMIAAGEEGGSDAPLDRWRRLRAAIHAEICRCGFSPKLGAFTRDFDSEALDASVLLLPQIGFLPPDDPRIVGTVDAIGRRLCRDGFIRRYDAHVSDDGLPHGDSSFLPCSFWYADALALIGRRAEAETVFERVLSVRNDVGLLAEEYDTENGLLTGNFPQALSHLSLVNTALNLTGKSGPAHRRSGKA